MSTQERIKQDAEEFVTSGPWGNPQDDAGKWMYEKVVSHYEIGALSERNKTIEEVKMLHQQYLNLQIGTEGTSFEQLLESLKV